MTPPSNGITPEVIREILPPYHLSGDLLEATITALPPPPPDAPARWRLDRITRLVEEIVAFLPADAAQARIAAQILIMRERADALTTRSYAPDVTVDEMCRLSRTSAALVRTATESERALARHQKLPTPFFGTVVEDEVDIGRLDAVWCRDPRVNRPGASPMQQSARGSRPDGGDAPAGDAAAMPAGEAAPAARDDANAPGAAPSRSGAKPPAAVAEPSPVATGVPVGRGPGDTDVAARQVAPVDAAASIRAGAGSASHDLGSDVAAGAAV